MSAPAPTVGPLRVPPAVTEVTAPFWTGGEHGELRVCRCDDCGTWSHPPRERCRACASRAMVPRPVSGRGHVASFTVNHQQWNPAGRTDPYVIAIVELVEQPGLRLITNVVGEGAERVEIGSPVTVRFEQLEDVWLPLFELDDPAP